MKKFLALIIIGLSFLLSPMNDVKGADGTLVVDHIAGGTWIHFRVSVDSAETFTSKDFDASEAIAWFMTMQNNYTARDTTIDNYFRLGNIFANVVCGTANDSLTYLYLKGAGSNGSYTTFDTLRTYKATQIRTTIDFYNATCLNPFWKISGKVYDTGTVDAVIYVDIFIPKYSRPGGGATQGENAQKARKGGLKNFG